MRALARRAAVVAAVGALSLIGAGAAQGAPGDIVLVANPDADGLDGVDAQGLIPSISEGGSFVALIEDDAAGGTSVFLRNMAAPGLIPVALSSGTEELGYDADSPGISADGRYVVFASEDPTVTGDDVNFTSGGVTGIKSPNRDIFVYDRTTKTTVLASRRSGATGAPATDDSNLPSISPDGRYVAFGTESSNLTAGKYINGGTYVRDLRGTRTTVLVSRENGARGKPLGGFEPSLSTMAVKVAFAASLKRGPGKRDNAIWVRDRRHNVTVVASRASGAHGAIANEDCGEPSISASGRYVAFSSKATNLVRGDDHKVEDVFLRDLKTGRTTLVSRGAGAHGAAGSGDSSRPSISADGRYVAFQSYAGNLGPHDNGAVPDVFVKDMRTGRVYLASAPEGGGKADAPSASPSISPDGRYVAFNSKATNLNPSDIDRKIGVFRYQLR